MVCQLHRQVQGLVVQLKVLLKTERERGESGIETGGRREERERRENREEGVGERGSERERERGGRE